MTLNNQLSDPSAHERAVAIISSQIDSWLNATLTDCAGNEQRRLLAVLRTTETYSCCLRGIIALPGATREKSMSIVHGAELLIPALLDKIRTPKRNLNRSMSNEASFQWATSKLETAGELLSLKRIAEGGYSGVSQSIVHNDEEISIYPTNHNGEVAENLDRNRVNDRKRENEADILGQHYKKMIDLAAERTLSAETATSERLVISDAGDDFLNTMINLFKLKSREYIESESLPEEARIGPLLFAEWKTIAVHLAAQIEISFLRVFKAAREFNFPGCVNQNLFPKLLSRSEVETMFLNSCAAVNTSNVNEVIEVFTFRSVSSSPFIKKSVELPFPMLLEVGSDYFFLQNGAQGNPYWFMFEMLKLKYQKNYDQNLKPLEKIFENDFHAIFASHAYYRGKGEIDLFKENGEFLTDIDASIFEPKTNTLYIVQLYWPAPVAREMKARSSQIRNLRAKSKWIQDINSWFARMGETSNKEILKKLALDKLNIDTENLEIRLMVISRGWTRFAGQGPYENGAVWVSWTKLQEVLQRHSSAIAPLDRVYNELKETIGTDEWPTSAQSTTFRFSNLTIHLQRGELTVT